jgi:hypothetical protein
MTRKTGIAALSLDYSFAVIIGEGGLSNKSNVGTNKA